MRYSTAVGGGGSPGRFSAAGSGVARAMIRCRPAPVSAVVLRYPEPFPLPRSSRVPYRSPEPPRSSRNGDGPADPAAVAVTRRRGNHPSDLRPAGRRGPVVPGSVVAPVVPGRCARRPAVVPAAVAPVVAGSPIVAPAAARTDRHGDRRCGDHALTALGPGGPEVLRPTRSSRSPAERASPGRSVRRSRSPRPTDRTAGTATTRRSSLVPAPGRRCHPGPFVVATGRDPSRCRPCPAGRPRSDPPRPEARPVVAIRLPPEPCRLRAPHPRSLSRGRLSPEPSAILIGPAYAAVLPAKKKAPAKRRGPFLYIECRRRPTLPHPDECSTIGAGGLSFRVRDGTGRSPSAKTTDNTINLSPQTQGPNTRPRTTHQPAGRPPRRCWLCAQGHTVDASNKSVVGKPSAY